MYLKLISRAGDETLCYPRHPGQTAMETRMRQKRDREAAVVWACLFAIAVVMFLAGVLVGRG